MSTGTSDAGFTKKISFCDICSPQPGCGVICTIDRNKKVVGIEGNKDNPGGRGFLCTKGLAVRQYIYRKDRLTTPLRRVGARGSGEFEPVSWEEAFREITKRLLDIRQNYGASSVAFYSGYNKWYRPYLQRLCYSFGSVNYGSESSTCFSATAMSHLAAAGYDAMMPDRKNCGTFLGWGYNPYYSRNAAGIKKGTEKVIIVDPRITPAVTLEADLHLRPIPGTDGALAHAIARELIVNDLIDHDFIKNHVYGFEEYKNYVMAFTPGEAQRITSVPKEKIVLAARIIGENKPLCINQSASAYVHHKNGFQNHRAIHALAALTGSYDVPGGIIPSPDTLAHARAGFETQIHRFEFEKYPTGAPLPIGGEKYPIWNELVKEMQACDLARQIKEGTPYPVKAVVAHGMNYRMFNADKELKEALEQLDFYVDTDLFLTDSAKLADIVLPACYSFERSELKVYPGGFVQYFRPAIEPVGMPDDDIIFELARRLDVEDDLLKAGRDACYKAIFPMLDIDALKKDPDHLHKADISITPVGKAGFKTPTGKYELLSTVLDAHPGFDALPVYKDSLDDADQKQFPLQLVAGGRLPFALHSRLHDIPWLRALRPEAMADIHPDEAGKYGISTGEHILLSTAEGSISVGVNITAMVPEGLVYMYHGYPEADVNSIVPKDHNDPYSGFPGFRSVRCRIEKCTKDAKLPYRSELSATRARSACMDKCTGCGACAIACMEKNDLAAGQKPYRRIEKFEEGEKICYSSSACMHCEDPACVKACPKGCIYKDEESALVLYDNTGCIGCGQCAAACPFDAVSFREEPEIIDADHKEPDRKDLNPAIAYGKRKMEKCDGCIDRIKAGLMPFCEQNCPTGALQIKKTR